MKKIIKRIFILVLGIIMICLSFIAFSNLNNSLPISMYIPISNEYSLIDKSESCAMALELIYETNMTAYFLPCIKSNSIYLEYVDGTIISLRDAIDEEKVSIESLIEHGLDVISEPIGEISVVNE